MGLWQIMVETFVWPRGRSVTVSFRVPSEVRGEKLQQMPAEVFARQIARKDNEGDPFNLKEPGWKLLPGPARSRRLRAQAVPGRGPVRGARRVTALGPRRDAPGPGGSRARGCPAGSSGEVPGLWRAWGRRGSWKSR